MGGRDPAYVRDGETCIIYLMKMHSINLIALFIILTVVICPIYRFGRPTNCVGITYPRKRNTGVRSGIWSEDVLIVVEAGFLQDGGVSTDLDEGKGLSS